MTQNCAYFYFSWRYSYRFCEKGAIQPKEQAGLALVPLCVPIGVECSQQRQWRRPHNHNHKIMVADFIYILLFLFPPSANGSPDDACNHREDESHRVMGWSHNVSAFYTNTLSLSLLHAPLLTTKSYAFCFSSTRTWNWEKCRIIVALENCETPDLVENERW